MKLLKKLTSFLLSAALTAGILTSPLNVLAGEDNVLSNPDVDTHEYYGNTSAVPNEYLTRIDNGYMVVKYNSYEDNLMAIYYNDDFQYTDNQIIPMELPMWGGFYSDGTCYYLLTGQDNYEEDANLPVFNLTKYDTDWNKLSTGIVTDCNTTSPFRAASSDFVSYGNILYVHTGHQMYQSSDGLRHQANVTLIFNTDDMTLLGKQTGVYNSSVGYCSHSFNQFIERDGSSVVYADHGDAYPRGMLISVFEDAFEDVPSGYSYVDASYLPMSFPGGIGDNYTGAQLGGLAVSSTSYILVGTSVNQDLYGESSVQNAFMTVTNKETGDTRTVFFTSIPETDSNSGNPYITRVNDDLFLISFNFYEKLAYVFVDGNGNNVGEFTVVESNIASAEPIVADDRIIWIGESSEANHTAAGTNISRMYNFYSIPATPAADAEDSFNSVTPVPPTATPTPLPGYRWYFYDGYSYGEQVENPTYTDTDQIDMDLTNYNSDGQRYYTVSYNNTLMYTSPSSSTEFEGYYYPYNNSLTALNGYLASGEYTVTFYDSNDNVLVSGSCHVINTTTETGVPSPTPTNTPTPRPVTNTPTPRPAANTPTPRPITNTPSRPTSAPVPSNGSGVEGFCERLYTCALNRASEAEGRDWWVNALRHGANGADAASGFFFSDELQSSGISDSEFIHRLYLTFMDREPSSGEMSYWIEYITDGHNRSDVFWGFIHSTEWANICLSYGILSGGNGVPTITITPSDEITAFTERLYTTCLGRAADEGGLNYWSFELANLRVTGSEAAQLYFFSEEFLNANVNNHEFVNRLYLTFMDRNAALGEFDYWLNEMNHGMSRMDVFSGFANSEEFGNICANYGILR